MQAAAGIVMAITLSWFITGAADAGGFVDGNKLYEWCQGFTPQTSVPRDGYRFSSCEAYVLGSADVPYTRGFCLDDRVTSTQIVDVVVAFLRDHPGGRHHLAAIVVAQALATAFPCD